MAVRALRFEGDPALRAKAAVVDHFDTDLAGLIADLFDTMYDAAGRGLAAPQLGVSARVFVTDIDWKTDAPCPKAFVNPKITAQATETLTGQEACLSIPDRAFDVARPVWVDAQWCDATGQQHSARFDGVQAVCFCHELDHLDGILITDHGVAR